MRRAALLFGFVISSFALWPASPAMASHSPCDPAGPVCIRVTCPSNQPGNGWIWLDHHFIPHADFTDCVSL